jgi:hypothetical protein
MGYLPLETSQDKTRQHPGFLFYPNEFSHVFEKYWDYIVDLEEHPDFMAPFSRGLSGRAAQGTFKLRASTEVREEDILITEHTAVSRLRPIQGGLEWGLVERVR